MTTTFKQPRLSFKLAIMAAAAVLGAGLSAPGQAANNASANATGTVVTPIAIAAAGDLAFGTFAPSGAAGTVTVSNSGVRSASGAVLLTGAAPTAARFNITGQAASTYTISFTGTSTTLTSGANNMALATTSDLTGANVTSGNVATGTLDGAGTQSLFVGGTLTVGAAQAPGVYTGSIIATVAYN